MGARARACVCVCLSLRQLFLSCHLRIPCFCNQPSSPSMHHCRFYFPGSYAASAPGAQGLGRDPAAIPQTITSSRAPQKPDELPEHPPDTLPLPTGHPGEVGLSPVEGRGQVTCSLWSLDPPASPTDSLGVWLQPCCGGWSRTAVSRPWYQGPP